MKYSGGEETPPLAREPQVGLKGAPISKLLHRLRICLGLDRVRYGDAVLPLLRMRTGGDEFKDDAYYLASARGEADRLIERCGLTSASRVLDVGCGPGRLPNGILARLGAIENYTGVDVSKPYVRWCRRYLGSQAPGFDFVHLDVQNPRYNTGGRSLGAEFQFPFPDASFDIIYLYSVFSHMVQEEMQIYLKDFSRILAPSGRMFITGFFEEGVEPMTVNPADYRMSWKGPLHCVRYNVDHFRCMLAEHGFSIDRFDYEQETDGQSGVYISRAAG